MFLKLPEWGNHHAPKPELILTFLPALNLDMEKLKVDMNDPAISKMIEQEITDGMRLQVRQTPTFFVNGQILNLRSENDLAEAIEAAM
jgi:protein-disulfide isomerase